MLINRLKPLQYYLQQLLIILHLTATDALWRARENVAVPLEKETMPSVSICASNVAVNKALLFLQLKSGHR